jgi:hypothetical protein
MFNPPQPFSADHCIPNAIWLASFTLWTEGIASTRTVPMPSFAAR